MREEIKSMEYTDNGLQVTCESGFQFTIPFPDDAVANILWAVENDEDFDNNLLSDEFENPEDGDTFIVNNHEIDVHEFEEMYDSLPDAE